MKTVITNLILFSLLIYGNAYALTFTQTGTEMTATYVEPTQNVDGTPLDDLVKTIIYYDIGSGPVVAKEVPATSPNGGGTITETFSVPVGPLEEKDVDLWVTAVDEVPNESPSPQHVIKTIDRLPPDEVQ